MVPMHLLAGFHVTDEIDLTGIATVVLALATAGLAWWTRRAVEQGRTEVERAHRPVLVPVTERSQLFTAWGEGTVPLMPTYNSGNFHLPIRNVGMGPALDMKAEITFGDSEGKPSTHGIESTAHAEAAGISHETPWTILTFRPVPISGPTGFSVTLTYSDVADMRWSTTARYSQDAQSYPDMTIRPA
jgi:hypothetical protein